MPDLDSQHPVAQRTLEKPVVISVNGSTKLKENGTLVDLVELKITTPGLNVINLRKTLLRPNQLYYV